MVEILCFGRAPFVVVGLVNLLQVLHQLIYPRICPSYTCRSEGCKELSHRQQPRRFITKHVKQNVFHIFLVDVSLTAIERWKIR